MLWIGLYLPELALQIVERDLATPGHAPAFVIKDGSLSQPVVYAANAVARSSGISGGMKIAAAQALNADLLIVPRRVDAEVEALHKLAAWAGQFTPAIVVEADAGLLLEVAASLNLFKGLTNLLQTLRRGLAELGYLSHMGVAPTSRAAWLLAKANTAGKLLYGCQHRSELAACLDNLPLRYSTWPVDTLMSLRRLGVITFQQFRALPRDQISRRFGPQPLLSLDQTYGVYADPRPWYTPPERYRARSEFLQEITQVEALLFPLNRLLLELEGFLRARDAGVQTFTLIFEFEWRNKAALRLDVGLLAAERDAARLLLLVRERLERTPPDAPVLAIRLEADTILPFVPLNHNLLADKRSQAMDWRQLRERLQARLGQDALFVLQAGNDHRPEFATVLSGAQATVSNTLPSNQALRPSWLLPQAKQLAVYAGRPHCQGPLELQAGPERIESGWWDGRPVHRDYYVACNPAGETFWIYREHQAPQQWFLHGLFA